MKQLSFKRTMERYVLLGSFLLFATATAAPPSHGYRTDYEYSQITRSYYKIHVESHNIHAAKEICALEGAEVMAPVPKENLKQAHKMMKKFPDLGNYLWILNDGDKEQHQVAEDPQMELEMSSDDRLEALKNSYECEVMTRRGEIELLGCNQKIPFICMVEEKNAPYDSQCGVYGRGYTYIASVGSCYKIPNMPMKWDGAYDECQAEGAHMLVLNSAAESAAVKINVLDHAPRLRFAQTTYFFHAGIRANEPTDGSQRVFRTIFNETLEEAGFSTWSEGEPNNAAGLEQCGTVFSNNGLYNDVECNHLYGFVCEKEVHLTQ